MKFCLEEGLGLSRLRNELINLHRNRLSKVREKGWDWVSGESRDERRESDKMKGVMNREGATRNSL